MNVNRDDTPKDRIYEEIKKVAKKTQVTYKGHPTIPDTPKYLKDCIKLRVACGSVILLGLMAFVVACALLGAR